MSAKGMRDVEEGTETAMRAVGSESKEKPMDTLSQSLASAMLQQEPRDAPSRKEAEARPHASSWSARPAAIRKDPNAPKRGLQPYMFFANEQRENVKRENLGLIFGQVGKALGERRFGLSDKQRAPYEAMAAEDNRRYESETARYNARQ